MAADSVAIKIPRKAASLRQTRRAAMTTRAETFAQFLDRVGLSMAFQPIVDLKSRRVEGFEALSRFAVGRTDQMWAQARSAGFDAQLELACIMAAIQQLHMLPAKAYLSLNASPNVILLPEFAAAFVGVDVSRIVIEITEEARVENYEELDAALAPLIRRGARLALDDVGSGFTGIAHILRLGPSILKLDLSVTQNIESDPRKRALAESLAEFAQKTKSKIVAEGIEEKKDIGVLRSLGISTGQGYLFGKPMPVGEIQTTVIKKYMKDSVVDLALAWKRVLKRRLVAIPTVALLVGSILVGPTATAFAENAQPGEALWSAKLRMEDFRLAIEDSPSGRISLGMEFAARRVGELSALLMEDGDATSSRVVAKSFSKHADATVNELGGLGAAGLHSRSVVIEAFTRHHQVLSSLVALSCSVETQRANACDGLSNAVESSQKALQAIEQSANAATQTGQSGGGSAGQGLSQANSPEAANSGGASTPWSSMIPSLETVPTSGKSDVGRQHSTAGSSNSQSPAGKGK